MKRLIRWALLTLAALGVSFGGRTGAFVARMAGSAAKRLPKNVSGEIPRVEP